MMKDPQAMEKVVVAHFINITTFIPLPNTVNGVGGHCNMSERITLKDEFNILCLTSLSTIIPLISNDR